MSLETVFLWLLVVLAPATAWSIFRVSPIGVVLPGAIGVAAALRKNFSARTVCLCVAMAYIIGVTVIFCADVITNAYDPLILNDDSLRLQITRVWAALGILGATGGAILGGRFSGSNPTEDRAEP